MSQKYYPKWVEPMVAPLARSDLWEPTNLQAKESGQAGEWETEGQEAAVGRVEFLGSNPQGYYRTREVRLANTVGERIGKLDTSWQVGGRNPEEFLPAAD